MPNSPENLEKIVEQCILMEIQAMRLYTTLANRVTRRRAECFDISRRWRNRT